MINEIKPSNSFTTSIVSVFLAGSIEMGLAENWQEKIINEFSGEGWNITFYNPRRDNWDSEWSQEQKSEHFNNQVNWEMNHLESASLIFLYLSPETKSPISLLELGAFGDSGKMIVCCPQGFWRKGNVEIFCTRKNIPFFENLEDAIGALKTKIFQL